MTRKTRQAKLLTVAVRDNWTCWLCDEPVEQFLRGSGKPMAPSLDHVRPQADGGTHELHNLRLAHARCNSLRLGNGGRMGRRSAQ